MTATTTATAGPATEELVRRARSVIPGGVNSSSRRLPGCEDLTVVATDGAYFTTADGAEIADFQCGFGATLLGHNDPDVNAAVAETAARTDLVGYGISAEEVALAERLVTHLPGAERVLLCNSGSEATFHAIRLARVATGRPLVVKFQGAYHGWSDTVLPGGVGTPADRLNTPYTAAAGLLPEVVAQTLVVPFNDLDAMRAVFAAHPGRIAAVIVEPILHALGNVLPEDGFHAGVRDITAEHGAVMIFDEVVTGFRHALGGYQSLIGLTPDLTTFGKAVANGYPIAGVAGRADLMDGFATNPGGRAFFGGTFNGNPAMAAAASACIDKLAATDPYPEMFRLGDRIRTGMQEIFDEAGVSAVTSGFGSCFNTYFIPKRPVRRQEDVMDNDADLYVGLRLEGVRHGVFEIPLAFKRSIVSAAHTDTEVDRLLESTRASLRTVLARRAAGTR
ncbi:aspartate aminotransferase family protein [Pseudonocardia alni]|uniref:aspartate aminotransferase family protein n=1 Tax=Pseudonocardia alni TaxID=33907 RepID=UPI0033F9E31B